MYSDASKAKCKECSKVYSLGNVQPKLQTVSGLKGHLASCHKDAYATFLKRAMDDGADRAAKKAKLNDIALKQIMPNFVQPSMKDITEKRLVWSDDNAIAQRIDKTRRHAAIHSR